MRAPVKQGIQRPIVGATIAALVATSTLVGGVTANHGTFRLLSGGSTGDQAAYQGSSSDGSRVFFETSESLVAGDGDSGWDVYQAYAGSISLVSTGTGSDFTTFAGTSADGTRVWFQTSAQLAGDGDYASDVYEASGGTVTLLSGSGPATSPSATFRGASADGTKVFFETVERINRTLDTDNVADIYEASGGTISKVTPGNAALYAYFLGASADGSSVLFSTTEVFDGSDTAGTVDVFRQSAGATTRLSAGSNVSFAWATASADRVFFHTTSQLAAEDTDSAQDVYESFAGSVTLRSGGSAAADATFAGASADGSRVFFTTPEALTADDTDTAIDDVYESSSGSISLLSGGTAAVAAFYAGTSADGSRVFFHTMESLTTGDTDTAQDVYQASGGGVALLSGGSANEHAHYSGASADGNRVFFESAETLVQPSGSGLYEAHGGALSHIGGAFEAVTADGLTLFIRSSEQLDPADSDSGQDVYEVTGGQDTDSPVITVAVDAADAAAGSGWYNIASSGTDGVLVHVSATDDTSVTNITCSDGATEILNTSSASGSITVTGAVAAHSIECVASDGVNPPGAGDGSTTMPVAIAIDQAAPSVSCLSPTVYLNASGPFDLATVDDSISGPLDTPAQGSPDTTTAGTHTTSVTGEDVAGNQATTDCQYLVTYRFAGFTAPLSTDTWAYVNARIGRNVPFRFTVTDANFDPVTGLDGRAIAVADTAGTCASPSTTLLATDYPKGRSGLVSLGGGSYEYRWKAPRADAGLCRAVSLVLPDGIARGVTFLFAP